MSFQDKSIQCSDCGTSFAFSAGEQEFFQTKGYTNEPRRCPSCRQAKRENQGNGGNGYSGSSYRAPRQMFTAICSTCGKEAQVPFEPREGRPVYCSACYTSVRPSR